MTSDLSSKQNFLYPKFLKPLGANGISQINPLSLFPDGIPGYIAPKSQNFADSQFFFNNRSIAIAESNYKPQVQSKNQTIDFSPTPSVTQQELNSKTDNIPDEDGEIDNFSERDRKIQNIHQHPTIKLKSNIQSNSSSNLSEVNIHKNESINPALEKPIINPETITLQSDSLSDVHLPSQETLTPSVEQPIINQEIITPQSDNLSDVELPDSELLNSSIKHPTINQETITPQSDSLSDVHLPNNQTITPAVEKPIIHRETVTPQSDKVSEVSAPNTNNLTPAVEKPIIHRETVTPQSDKVSEASASNTDNLTPAVEKPILNRETITPQSESISNVDSPTIDTITSLVEKPTLNQETITPQSESLSDVHLPNNHTITSSVDKSILSQETITPQSDNVAQVPSIHQVSNKNNSISTPEITSHSKPSKPFSLINLLRKAVDFFSPKNISVAEKEEDRNKRSPVFSPDIISSQSQTSSNPNTDEKLSVPDTWSSIAELINEPSPTNNTLNTKSENKSIEKNKINLENISSIQQIQNKSEPSLSKMLQNPPNNYYVQSLPTHNKNIDINHNNQVYKVQLSPENTIQSRYQYQSLTSKIILPEKASSDKLSIQEVDNSTLSRKEETPAEPETLSNDTERTDNASELLETLAGEIYNLLQQRLEIERERQGKYYL